MTYIKNIMLIVGAVVATLVAAAAAHRLQAPDLHRLYMQNNMVTDQPPVVFIHGILGGKLRADDSGRELWPGPLHRLLGSDYRDLRMAFDPVTFRSRADGISAYAVADTTGGRDFYGKILRTLSEVGGYERALPGQAVTAGKKHYYEFFYDWRQDNVLSARRLADFIDQIRADYGDDNLRVDIVAHSMGGLIARYYIRYGREDVVEDNDFPVNMYGGERVRRVVLLGTPNLGSVKILRAFIDGIKIGFRSIPPETLATMPSLYQLLPHPLNNWLITAQGRPLQRDLFDIETWRQFQWSIFQPEVKADIIARFDDPTAGAAYYAGLERYFARHIERARRFVWSLTVPLPEEHPMLVVFGGDCELTPARILVEEVDSVSEIRLYPEDIADPTPGIDYDALLLEPGDGSVTKASLLGRDTLDPSVPRHKYSFFPLAYAILLCENHNSLTGNLSFQDNLLNTLLSRD